MVIVCDICGQKYSGGRGGHCRGGKFGGCCRTFTNDVTGAMHRPVGGPCLTEEQMLERGWRSTPLGWTHNPPMSEEEKGALR